MKTSKAQQRFIEVAPAVPLSATKRQTFTYEAAEAQLQQIVKVPFGKWFVAAVVLEVHHRAPAYATKEAAIDIQAPTLTAKQIAFARTIADVMHGGLGYTLRLFSPPSGKLPVTQKKLPRLKKLATNAVEKTIATLPSSQAATIIEKSTSKRRQMIARLARQAVATGSQVYIVVPELSMIEDMVTHIAAQVPPERIRALHTTIGSAKQKAIWYGVQDGSVSIVVGTQKGFFLPWQTLGLVVIEQAYYTTHKLWDQYPRLHNVHIAPLFAALYQARLIYAGSIPSLFLYHQDKAQLSPIVHNEPLPTSIIAISPDYTDRQERNLLPKEVVRKITGWHRQKKTVVMLYNKKGAWQIIVCRSCHKALTCANCHSALTVHATRGVKTTYSLRCKHCAVEIPKPEVCPVCHKKALRLVKPGLETVSHIINSLGVKALSIDETQKKTLTPQRLAKAGFIIGTQALLTLIDKKPIDHVIWMNPEDALQFPDARSQEHARYLLARLQEFTPKTPVTIVTRQPALVAETLLPALSALWEKELKVRRQLHYPPVKDMVRLTISEKKEAQAVKRASALRSQLDERIAKQKVDVRILGPFTGFTSYQGKEVQMHIMMLGSLKDLTAVYRDVTCESIDYMPARIL